MKRVMVYVDGFNLYFGLRSKGWRKHYWLDLAALSRSLLKPDQTLVGVQYFTTRIRANGRNTADMQRQNTYLEALATLPELSLYFGHYLEKKKKCRQCGAQWTDYEEKMTDVNIAVEVLADAFADRFDTAMLISGDSDLTTPVRKLRQQFPEKRVLVVFPPDRHSFELKNSAHACFTVGEAKIRQAQLPETVQREDGFQLQRPAYWR